MSTSDLRSTGMRLIRNLMTLQTAIDPKPSPSIFQAMSMPVTQPTPSVAQPLPNIPISIVEVIEKENHYLKKLEEVIYRLKMSPNFNKVAGKVSPLDGGKASF